ncbi:hypothetical protein H8B13_20675 [Hymenobacter sp. BT188]|uniref:hypothetical protein n=1 Tax=Hymenobacter sp. BT188 TaxID=2763504 RepID=UPI001651A8B3|nr:hypothetical protein [Hymenobacter sp. BT188]MBC6609246.1 hypothetical protein [Hymenobacter sp. BT188]
MENASSASEKVVITVVDLGADPLVFAWQPDHALAPLVQVSVSRYAWLALGPSRAISYVADRFLLAYPTASPPGGDHVRDAVQRALERPAP